MANDISWIPDTVKQILDRAEKHYRTVGFKRTAHHMAQTLASVDKAPITGDFYSKYVKLLKDDVKNFISAMNFDDKLNDEFYDSMVKSIDAVNTLLEGLDLDRKTPSFNGTTTKKEDAEAVSAYFKKWNNLYDPIKSTVSNYDALMFADPMYEMVYSHVYTPGKDYMIAQLELALGRDRALELVDSILSVYGIIPNGKELVSDFRYAYQHPGKFDESETGWVLTDKVTIPVKSFARWAILMYYKVPIITAMLPIHNIIFFSLVQETVKKREAE